MPISTPRAHQLSIAPSAAVVCVPSGSAVYKFSPYWPPLLECWKLHACAHVCAPAASAASHVTLPVRSNPTKW